MLNFYVSDLLVLSQIQNNAFRKSISRFDVREAIREVITIQMEKAMFNNIQLVAEYTGFEDEDFMITTDKMRLKQVLLNYQSNALKFSKPNGTVTILCIKNSESIEVHVKDTGYGMK